MSRILFLVSVGGAIGSLARYLISIYCAKIFTFPFPIGTFMVNSLGCFLIGFFYGLSTHFDLAPTWRVFFIVGICGGFTTFSTFAFENLKLLQSEQYLAFATYSIGSYTIGLLAVYGGIIMVKTIFG
ncbi:MAG: fluoride efflux transporter CrcB [Chitinophagales bacterium]|nr:fluoride efflux transporter CrcB [Chitinophagales bacterium]